MKLASSPPGRDMRKAFNIQEGATRREDATPKRFLAESIRVGEAGHPTHRKEDFDELVTEYYQEQGWDPEEGTISP